MDRAKHLLVEAIRGGVDQREVRLYRAGKLSGLFGGRTALNSELAQAAIAQGLIEIVRTEVKGKTTVEWVRVTPRGVEFVLQAESPVHALEELKAVLELNRDGMPGWVAELRGQLEQLSARLVSEVETLRQRLDGMMARVNEALRRADKYGPPPPEGAAGALPWAHDVLDYLDQRQQAGLGEHCPLPELFGHVLGRSEGLSIRDFHSGLRRLHDRGLLRLLPADGPDGPPEPEYALLDGASLFYFAARAA